MGHKPCESSNHSWNPGVFSRTKKSFQILLSTPGTLLGSLGSSWELVKCFELKNLLRTQGAFSGPRKLLKKHRTQILARIQKLSQELGNFRTFSGIQEYYEQLWNFLPELHQFNLFMNPCCFSEIKMFGDVFKIPGTFITTFFMSSFGREKRRCVTRHYE